MTVEECYARMGADYKGAMTRIGNEAFLKQLFLMTYRDGNFADLKRYTDLKDTESAFRAAHTLKGIALNLGLTRLADAAGMLTEALRVGISDVGLLFAQTETAYREFRAAAEELLKEELGNG